MGVRLERARAIVSTAKVRRKGGAWLVPSQSGQGRGYVVTWVEHDPEGWRFKDGEKPGYRCTCPDYEHRRKNCKHILAVCLVLTKETERTETTAPDGTTTVTTTTRETATLTVEKRKTYPQVWPAYNAAQTQEKATFLRLLADLCAGIPQPEQHMGRKRHALPDVVFAAAFKVYSTLSARRFMTDMRDVQAKGYVAKAIAYNSLLRYFEDASLTPLLERLVATSALPLAALETTFAVDSTGLSVSKFARWFDHKYGEIRTQQQWMKVHAICGTKTNIITAVRVTHGTANDAPFLTPLVAETARGFQLDEVSADKAYSTRKNLTAIWNADAMPYIPFHANASGSGPGGLPGTQLYRRLFHYYNLERDAFLEHYHRRSNIETTFSMMKRKFGDALRSKTETAQFNEALLKVLCHNICCVIQSMHELGVSPDFGMAA